MNKLVLLFIAIILLSGCEQKKVIEIPYPTTAKFKGSQDRYFCEALIGTQVYAPSETIGKINKGVIGEVFKGTDKISIKIEGNKLYFLTGASFEVGDTAEENPMNIIHNDSHILLAIDKIESNLIVSVFTLNKDTGIGNWSKIKPYGLLTGNPDSQSYCLKCESR